MQLENIIKNYKVHLFNELLHTIIYQYKVLFLVNIESGKPYEISRTPKEGPNTLPSIKPEDLGYFGALLNTENETELSL